jgi:hypothetical protein
MPVARLRPHARQHVDAESACLLEDGGGPGSSEDDPPGPVTTPETVVTDGV